MHTQTKIYFFSNGSESEILIIVDDEIIFYHTTDLNDDSFLPSLVTHITTQPTSLGVEIADIPDISFDWEDIPDLEQLLGQQENNPVDNQFPIFNDKMNEQLETWIYILL